MVGKWLYPLVNISLFTYLAINTKDKGIALGTSIDAFVQLDFQAPSFARTDVCKS